jgi:hypothetical protein
MHRNTPPLLVAAAALSIFAIPHLGQRAEPTPSNVPDYGFLSDYSHATFEQIRTASGICQRRGYPLVRNNRGIATCVRENGTNPRPARELV